MRTLLERGNLTDDEIKVLIEFAKEKGGIEYSYSVMEKMREEADMLLVSFPDNKWRDMFVELFEFTIRRES